MILLGAGIGALAGRLVGDVAGYAGFAALFGLGLYMMRESRSQLSGASAFDLSRGWGLLLASVVISLDSLGIGFSILYVGVPLAVALGSVAIASICSTSLGLSLGRRLGRYAEQNAALIGGLLLALTGVILTLFKALHLG